VNRTVIQAGAVGAALVIIVAVVVARAHALSIYPNIGGPGL
jgi:hypothetical protein